MIDWLRPNPFGQWITPEGSFPEAAEVWAEELLEDKTPIESAVEMPIKQRLGCGAWGCVYEATSPWVVKFTLDPPEPHVWLKVDEAIEEAGTGQGGIVRVKDVFQLYPPIEAGPSGDVWHVYVIVREAIHPIFQRGRVLTDYTIKKLGLPTLTVEGEPFVYKMPADQLQTQNYVDRRTSLSAPGLTLYQTGLDEETRQAVKDFEATFSLLEVYKQIAAQLSNKMTRAATAEAFASMAAKDLEHLQLVFGELDKLDYGREIGETLRTLNAHGIRLRDLHQLNVGWRAHRTVPGFSPEPKTVVVFDVGATVIEPVEEPMRMEERFRQNPIL